jgi:hypothetical protein
MHSLEGHDRRESSTEPPRIRIYFEGWPGCTLDSCAMRAVEFVPPARCSKRLIRGICCAQSHEPGWICTQAQEKGRREVPLLEATGINAHPLYIGRMKE